MAKTRSVDSSVINYFAEPSTLQRQYLAMRNFLHDGHSAVTVASVYGYQGQKVKYKTEGVAFQNTPYSNNMM
jgi:hypothetical protein